MTWFLLWQQTGCLQASRKAPALRRAQARQAPKVLIAEPHMHNCRTAYAQIFKFFCSYSPFGGSPGKAACPKCVAYEAKLFRLSGDGHVSDKPPLILGATRLGILSAIVPRWARGASVILTALIIPRAWSRSPARSSQGRPGPLARGACVRPVKGSALPRHCTPRPTSQPLITHRKPRVLRQLRHCMARMFLAMSAPCGTGTPPNGDPEKAFPRVPSGAGRALVWPAQPQDTQSATTLLPARTISLSSSQP